MSADFHIFTRAKTAYEGTPLAKLTEAAMRGNAEMAGQAKAKQVASDQADANDKTSITLKGGKVTIKDADPSLIDGMQDQQVQEAYNAPHVAVANALSQQQAPQQAAAPDTAGIYDLVDKTVGHHVPRPTDPDIDEKLKTPEGIRALTLEIGGTRDHANRAVKEVARGQLSPQKIRETVQNWRAQNLSSLYAKSVKGPLDEAQQIGERKRAETDRQTTESRLKQTQLDAEKKTVYAKQNASIKGIDFSMVPAGEGNAGWRQAADDANDSGVPYTKEQYAIIERKAARDVEKSFDEFTSNADRFALGTYDTWEQAKGAFGHQLSPQQDAVGKARWEAAHTYVEKLDRDSAMKAKKDEAQLRHTYQLIAAATAEKPVAVGRGDLDLMPAAELLQMDPRVVKNYDGVLEAKAGLLRKTATKAAYLREKARAKVKSIEATPERERQYGWQTDLAGFKFDLQQGDRDAKAAEAELQAIEAKRAERRGTPIVAAPGAPPPVQVAPKPSSGGQAPKVGDKKTFTAGPYAGKTGTWNGSAYVVP